MNENDQRIAIAEACGWEHDGSVTPTPNGQPVFREWWQSPGAFRAHNADDLPDYLHDLNAMRDAEEFLTSQRQRDTYRDTLAMLTTVERYPKDLPEAHSYCAENEWAYCRATASQRAEAFLRTIGKWTDDPQPALPSPATATNKP